MPRLITHSSVRLYAPNKQGELWTVIQLLLKTKYLLNDTAAYVVVLFMGGADINECIHRCYEEIGLQNNDASKVIFDLAENSILVPEDDCSHIQCERISTHWQRFGWYESLDYYLLTHDYPFVDYDTPDAFVQDKRRMENYRSNETEPERYKQKRNTSPRVEGKPISECLSSLHISVPDALTAHRPEQGDLSVSDLMTLCTCAFGILRTRPIRNRPDIPPLIRKTSPSGGSRHPTEAYVLVLGVSGLQPAVYEYSAIDNVLSHIRDLPQQKEMEENLEGLYRASFKIKAVVILTSVFERNMFRYREPRTFRTIFLDAGHVAATVEIASRSLGINAYVQHGINDAWVENLLGLDSLREGVILGIALG